MAYTDYDTPGEVLTSGYSATSSDITMTIGSGSLLPDISSDEANATTGDFRKLMYGLIEGLYSKYNEVPTDDKPSKMILNRSTGENSSTGEFVRTYSIQFTLDATGFEVASET